MRALSLWIGGTIVNAAKPGCVHLHLALHCGDMKTIDIKSLIIGFLLSAVIFLAAGFHSAANAGPISVRLVEIDRGIGSDWDAIEVKGR